MGYTNRDKRIVRVARKEKNTVVRPRRRAEQRMLLGHHPRGALQATRRGWWYA